MSAIRLHVTINEAHNLKKAKGKESPDPYVTLQLKGDDNSLQKSTVKTESKDPVWNEEFDIICNDHNKDKVLINMYDGETKIMDEISLSVKQFKVGSGPTPQDNQIKLKKKDVGTLQLTFEAFESEGNKKSKSSKKSDVKKDDKKKARKSSDEKKKPRKSSDTKKDVEEKAEFPVTYQINIEAISASNLLAADKNGFSDPYVVVQVEGGTQKYMTNFIENNLNPVWNERISPLDGFYVSSDLIHIWVYDKDKKVDLKKNDCIAYAKLMVNDIGELGVIKDLDIPLYKVTKDKKTGIVSQATKSHRGDAGHLKLRVHIAQVGDEPFSEKPWKNEFLVACLELNDAKDCPPMSGKLSDPYVVMTISPAANAQRYKTIVQKNTLNPSWNEQYNFFVDDPQTQKINFQMFHDTQEMGTTTISLANLDLGEITDMETQLSTSVKDHKGGILRYRITLIHKGDKPFEIKERDINIEEGHCSFSWGTYSSSYSTSFSGYSNNSSTLSDFHPSEEQYHIHIKINEQTYSTTKPKKSEITGKFIGCTDLIQCEPSGTDAYVKISHLSKAEKTKGEVQTDIVQNSQNPEYNTPFTFPNARKGDKLDIAVYQDLPIVGAVMIGHAEVQIKNINESTTLNVDLLKPPVYKIPKKFGDFVEYGKCSLEVSANYIE